MKKSIPSLFASLFIFVVVYCIFFSMTPQFNIENNVALSEFSVNRVKIIVKNIAQKPHYIGSENHKNVMNYLFSELNNMGLKPSIQSGFTLTESGILTKSSNIIARIKGSDSSKALLLLSHYDSAPHSKSKGASDNGSGVATILEGIRTFLNNKSPHKNDIIILFSDAEEVGLNGAALFVTQHKWAKKVGIALNFEARGTSGPSYMLMEVNAGNGALLSEFSKANVAYPNSNSLIYSVYKMHPNDTDLTIFRENAQIQGLNFAFIDNHFNYHSDQDDLQHLDSKSIAHHGSYLMPLLNYFSNSDLNNLESDADYVYFNTPLNFVKYPFSWTLPMSVFAIFIFVTLIFVGLGKRILDIRLIFKGFLLFFVTVFLAGSISFLMWELIKIAYPHYNEILQGFTYNGHSYMYAFLFLTLSICFFTYRKKTAVLTSMNYAIAPIFVWLLINLFISIYFKGAAFFIIPVFSGLIGLGYFIIAQKTNKILNLILIIPTLVVFAPFIYSIPIGLGMKVIYAVMIFVGLVFGLLLPVFDSYYKKRNWALLMLFIAIGFILKAHFNSGFENGRAKPNSLVYAYDADSNTANWFTYDIVLDHWTQKYFTVTDFIKPNTNSSFNSKYKTKYSFSAKAPSINITKPVISFLQDEIAGNFRYLKIKIQSVRKANQYEVFVNKDVPIYNLRANGVQHINQKKSLYLRPKNLLLTYYLVDNQPLELSFSVPKEAVLDLYLHENSFDLLDNKQLNVRKRPFDMMPKPFVLTDAIILKMKIKAPIFAKKPMILEPARYQNKLIQFDSIQ